MPRLLDPTALQGDIEAAREHFQLGRPMTSLRRLKAIRTRIERTHDERTELRRLVARIMVSQASAHYEVTGDLQAALDLLTGGPARRIIWRYLRPNGQNGHTPSDGGGTGTDGNGRITGS